MYICRPGTNFANVFLSVIVPHLRITLHMYICRPGTNESKFFRDANANQEPCVWYCSRYC